jgi:hypothetical protein
MARLSVEILTAVYTEPRTHASSNSPFLPVFRSLEDVLRSLSLSMKALSLSTVTVHKSRERKDCGNQSPVQIQYREAGICLDIGTSASA